MLGRLIYFMREQGFVDVVKRGIRVIRGIDDSPSRWYDEYDFKDLLLLIFDPTRELPDLSDLDEEEASYSTSDYTNTDDVNSDATSFTLSPESIDETQLSDNQGNGDQVSDAGSDVVFESEDGNGSSGYEESAEDGSSGYEESAEEDTADSEASTSDESEEEAPMTKKAKIRKIVRGCSVM